MLAELKVLLLVSAVARACSLIWIRKLSDLVQGLACICINEGAMTCIEECLCLHSGKCCFSTHLSVDLEFFFLCFGPLDVFCPKNEKNNYSYGIKRLNKNNQNQCSHKHGTLCYTMFHSSQSSCSAVSKFLCLKHENIVSSETYIFS
jgi:hypothetical protein